VSDFVKVFCGGASAEGVGGDYNVCIGWVWTTGPETSLLYGIGLQKSPGYVNVPPSAGADWGGGATGDKSAAPGFGFVWVR
jgi:hypothetical protein